MSKNVRWTGLAACLVLTLSLLAPMLPAGAAQCGYGVCSEACDDSAPAGTVGAIFGPLFKIVGAPALQLKNSPAAACTTRPLVCSTTFGGGCSVQGYTYAQSEMGGAGAKIQIQIARRLNNRYFEEYGPWIDVDPPSGYGTCRSDNGTRSCNVWLEGLYVAQDTKVRSSCSWKPAVGKVDRNVDLRCYVERGTFTFPTD